MPASTESLSDLESGGETFLKLPKIGSAPANTRKFHQLNNLVRREYYVYLEKMLTQNYNRFNERTNHQEPPDEVRKCAVTLELNALRSSIVIELYRKQMLRVIAQIRSETDRQELNGIFNESKIEQTRDMGCQTEDDPPHKSLDDRIESLLKSPKRKHPKRVTRRRYAVESVTKETTPVVADNNDEIEKEMESMFAAENNEFDEIFGVKLPVIAQPPPVIKEPLSTPQPELVETASPEIVTNRQIRRELMDSIWPCELHFQRLSYRNRLLNLADRGIRHHDKIKRRILELFGDDSDDEEIALLSPSIQNDEVLVASSKKRIAPWIVTALMVPLKCGKISDRYVFKRVAKHIAELILEQNFYPSSDDVKHKVDEYFLIHRQILSVDDIW